jgi:uncharacterized protein
MKKPRVPRKLLDPMIGYFKPRHVILFGSRARGEATRESDIDLLVIVDDDTPSGELTWKAEYEAHRAHSAADVLPMHAETFERYRNIVGTLAAEADADGPTRIFASPTRSLPALSTEWLVEVRRANEDSLLDIGEHLPQEAPEALLNLATGTTREMPETDLRRSRSVRTDVGPV